MSYWQKNRARGERLPQSKLTAEAVRQMRAEHTAAYQQIHDLRKRYSTTALADRYGVSPDTIRDAIQGVTWGHVR